MRRIKIVFATLFISLLPFSMIFGQEKKSEQKIKIIVADESGTKVVIDTVLNNSPVLDSIRLKNGEVIYIGRDRDEHRYMHGQDRGRAYIRISPDEKGTGKETREITVISSDSIGWTQTPKACGQQYIYINDDKVIRKDGEKKFDVYVSTDQNDSNVNKTKYVIAKNGIVVSVEGDDEVKVKEIINLIENKLDVNKEEQATKAVVKEVEKKQIKKK